MEEVTKSMLKDWIEKGHRKAYKSLVIHYALLFENIGFKASVEEIEKDLDVKLKFNSVYYAYRKAFNVSTPKKEKFITNKSTKEFDFKNASELNSEKPKFDF